MVNVKRLQVFVSAFGTKVKVTEIVKTGAHKNEGFCRISNVSGKTIQTGTARFIFLDSLRRRYTLV